MALPRNFPNLYTSRLEFQNPHMLTARILVFIILILFPNDAFITNIRFRVISCALIIIAKLLFVCSVGSLRFIRLLLQYSKICGVLSPTLYINAGRFASNSTQVSCLNQLLLAVTDPNRCVGTWLGDVTLKKMTKSTLSTHKNCLDVVGSLTDDDYWCCDETLFIIVTDSFESNEKWTWDKYVIFVDTWTWSSRN